MLVKVFITPIQYKLTYAAGGGIILEYSIEEIPITNPCNEISLDGDILSDIIYITRLKLLHKGKILDLHRRYRSIKEVEEIKHKTDISDIIGFVHFSDNANAYALIEY